MKDPGFLHQIGLAADSTATNGHGPASWEVSRRDFFKIGAATAEEQHPVVLGRCPVYERRHHGAGRHDRVEHEHVPGVDVGERFGQDVQVRA